MVKGFIKKIIGKKKYNYLIDLKLKKNALFNYGNKYECPVCSSNVRRFLPGGLDVEIIRKLQIVGAGRFDNQICPVCKSFNRDRLLILFLRRKTDIFKKKLKLLHIAPEKGIQRIFKISNNIDYLSADLDSSLADIKMDITDINFPENSFDIVICNHVLEHIPEDMKAMSEIRRIIRPNGWAILQVPISYVLKNTYEDFSILDPKEREEHFGQNDHVRIYAIDYLDRLRASGLDVTSVETGEYLTDEEISRFGVIGEEKIFFCTVVK
ncbi:MAG: class I SAM-dependent methyltransferase [Ignavibacteria bacterium]